MSCINNKAIYLSVIQIISLVIISPHDVLSNVSAF